jgi:hypothetical protein
MPLAPARAGGVVHTEAMSITIHRRPRLAPLALAAGTAIALATAACGTAVVSPGLTAGPTESAGPTPTPVTVTPVPTLAPIGLADFGPGAWKLIATETNIDNRPITELLGRVDVGFSYVFTCTGSGPAVVTISASTSEMVAAAATPIDLVDRTYQCPTTEVGEHYTGIVDGGTYSLSPNVNYAEGVTYRLIVATLPN